MVSHCNVSLLASTLEVDKTKSLHGPTLSVSNGDPADVDNSNIFQLIMIVHIYLASGKIKIKSNFSWGAAHSPSNIVST